jgi:L-ascorbate metabolism protein UlaG (beta-lactamase superfamily)
MVPVDGGYTMGQDDMLEVLRTIKARVVIPMHYFGPTTLNRFIATMGKDYELETSASPERIVTVAEPPGYAEAAGAAGESDQLFGRHPPPR